MSFSIIQTDNTQNHEEHERRWAQGSFLSLIQEYIKRKSGAYLQGWQIWLSMNPEMDGTAIWLERKFDVPASGQWISDIIFSIPFASSRFSQVSPGLIVFERTPLEGITDDIERYFRSFVYDHCLFISYGLGNIVFWMTVLVYVTL